jgi:hypothetical protein
VEGGGGEERRAYTWLRERESGERVKASEEGAGMMMWNGNGRGYRAVAVVARVVVERKD